MLKTARSYLRSYGHNTGVWRAERRTDGQTDRRTELLYPYLVKPSAWRAKQTRCKRNPWAIKSGNGHRNPCDPSEKVRETMEGRIYGKGKCWVWSRTEMEWCIYSESGDDGDDDESVRERWDDSDRDSSSSTDWQSSLGSSFQRRGETWRKERLLTFKEEYNCAWARVTTSEERVLRSGWREIRS